MTHGVGPPGRARRGGPVVGPDQPLTLKGLGNSQNLNRNLGRRQAR